MARRRGVSAPKTHCRRCARLEKKAENMERYGEHMAMIAEKWRRAYVRLGARSRLVSELTGGA